MKLRDSLVRHDSIVLQAEAASWQEAVAIGVKRLEAAGVVDDRYYPGILANVEELGPYFLLAPGLAMPHARPENGVLQNGFALVTLKTPVVFGSPENDPVDILITLAAVDAKSHNEGGIMQVVALFDDETSFDQLRACTTPDQVLVLLDAIAA
ncbi:PTS ascorbate transporter subunit IIA [Jeongeupia sp. USM3]|uniref:PTS ascorbate transporter subunit IIA n=1 Tax=Jeongeupia sp. USM3 TaxID=1906741 RepID=UPI00089DF4E5|nr:PTS ascorbate transporter subunit IIA [Jeongeupia sp. USM3]AOY01106.1 PTS ascorbate-specific transporter subunit IIA [Jeongeupia sp. USM3]